MTFILQRKSASGWADVGYFRSADAKKVAKRTRKAFATNNPTTRFRVKRENND